MPNQSPVTIEDPLAMRYASPAMRKVWSLHEKVRLERDLWLALLRAQQELGVDIPLGALEAYERMKDEIDLEDIALRERALRHDVKARIEAFCALAGYEVIHQGMTSRDLTDNVEQLQVQQGLALLIRKTSAVLLRFAEHAKEQAGRPLTGRTHNVPAQLTTLGKRLAMFGEELLLAFEHLECLILRYPMRGLKGAVGGYLDASMLLGGIEQAKAAELAWMKDLAGHHQVSPTKAARNILHAVGQIYPRSLDFEVVSALHQLCAPLTNFANTLRLMAGAGLALEGFKQGQVGSSAMPHKVNARSCERICGLHVIMGGFVDMCARLSGSQWNEGDVACSVVRRVALPGAMFATDGALETCLTVLDEMGFYTHAIATEVQRELPFLATGALLMAGVKAGGGREKLHAVIREHALASAQALRNTATTHNDLPERLGQDDRFPLSLAAIKGLLQDPQTFVGDAPQQALAFARQVEKLVKNRYPSTAALQPMSIL